jgi:hypothetical protein
MLPSNHNSYFPEMAEGVPPTCSLRSIFWRLTLRPSVSAGTLQSIPSYAEIFEDSPSSFQENALPVETNLPSPCTHLMLFFKDDSWISLGLYLVLMCPSSYDLELPRRPSLLSEVCPAIQSHTPAARGWASYTEPIWKCGASSNYTTIWLSFLFTTSVLYSYNKIKVSFKFPPLRVCSLPKSSKDLMPFSCISCY